MSSVDMKGLKALAVKASEAWTAWIASSKFALENHASYSQAMSAAKTAIGAFEAERAKAQAIIDQLAADPETDPIWFSATGGGPVPFRNEAVASLNQIEWRRRDVLRDILAHWKIDIDAKAYPDAAAAAADAAAKASGIHNLNVFSPGTQSSSAPPVDTPPPSAGPSATTIGIAAAAGLGALWLARKVL